MKRKANDNDIRCFAINNFGEGCHPYADEQTLEYFKRDYIRECLRKCASNQCVLPYVARRAQELAEPPDDSDCSPASPVS